MDITIEVMPPPRNAADFTDGEVVNGYDVGWVVTVYDHLNVVDTVAMPSTGYLHVTGVPDDKFEQIKAVLESPWLVVGALDLGVFKERKWRVDPSKLTQALRRELIDQRQATVTWMQLRDFFVNKAEQDRVIADTDLA